MPKLQKHPQLIILTLITFFLLNVSCRKDLDFENSKKTTFRFSQDTVFLDTIFTKSNSETFLLKVYNDTDEDVSISNLYLNQKENSPFRINVDGRFGYEFNEIPLRGKDSLMIFVEIAMGESQDFWAEDEIIFENLQQIKLLAAIEDAIYYYPKDNEIYSEITENTEWDNSKSHIIYGKLRVQENRILKINSGTKIYFHQNGSLEIAENASLIANGNLNEKIIFRTDRHSTRYDSLPKQWREIKLLPDSKFNATYTVIKGADNGLNLENAVANLENVEIYNSGSSGIYSKNSKIIGKNIAISDAGEASLNIENGGDYTFYFSTFTNMSETGVLGVNGPNIPLYLSDYMTINDSQTTNPLNAFFANSIFYGKYKNGVFVDLKDSNNANYSFESCLIKNEDIEEVDYLNQSNFKNTIIDNPLFISTIYSNQDLRLKEESPAKKQGNPLYLNNVPKDILGKNRNQTPTIGAYE